MKQEALAIMIGSFVSFKGIVVCHELILFA